MENCRFSGRLWPDWGYTPRAAMAGLGYIRHLFAIKQALHTLMLHVQGCKVTKMEPLYELNNPMV